MKLIIRETLSHSGSNYKTHIMENRSEILIGRGFINDIILGDAYVCDSHVKLSHKEGFWFIKDEGSLNGIRNAKGDLLPQNQELRLRSGERYKIGHTYLKFFTADQQVKPTKFLNVSGDKANKYDNLKVTACMFLALLLSTLLYTYTMSSSDEAHIEFVVSLLGFLGFSLLYAGLLSITGLIARTHAYFFYHLSLAFGYFMVTLFYEPISEVMFFYSEEVGINSMLGLFVTFGLLIYILRVSLIATIKKIKAINIVTALLALVMVGGVMYTEMKEDEWRGDQINNSLVPYASSIDAKPSVEELFKDNADLFQRDAD